MIFQVIYIWHGIIVEKRLKNRSGLVEGRIRYGDVDMSVSSKHMMHMY